MARKRKAGDGTVRQRKDGRWEGRIVIGYDDNGYPKTKNVLAKTKKECVEKLQKLKEECGGLKSRMVLQIHDELLFDTVHDEIDTLMSIVKEQMEHVTELSVPLTVECNYGKNWLEAH